MQRVDAGSGRGRHAHPGARTRRACLPLLLGAFLAVPACGGDAAEQATAADSAAVDPAASAPVDSPAAVGDPEAVAGAGAGAGGRPGAVSTQDVAAPTDSAALALDSLRREVRRLSAAVEASTRASDSVLARLAAAPGGGPEDATGATVGTTEGVLKDAAETARSYGVRAFWAVLVLVLTFFAVRAAAYALNALSERSAERRLFYKRLVPVARIVLWTFAVYFVIRVVFAVDAQGLFAAAAAVGVAVGFAAQDLLKNIFGGLVIVFDQPFQVGDKIQVGDSYGEVVSIGLRSTRIVTPDDSLVSVPNAQIVDSQVSNANSGALDCQVVTDLYLPGFVDDARAKAIAYQAAVSSRYVYLQKPIVVLVKDEFKETFLTHLKVKAYVMDARHEFAFMSDVTERARAEFRRHGLLTPTHGARAWVTLSERPDDGDGADAARPPGPTEAQ